MTHHMIVNWSKGLWVDKWATQTGGLLLCHLVERAHTHCPAELRWLDAASSGCRPADAGTGDAHFQTAFSALTAES